MKRSFYGGANPRGTVFITAYACFSYKQVLRGSVVLQISSIPPSMLLYPPMDEQGPEFQNMKGTLLLHHRPCHSAVPGISWLIYEEISSTLHVKCTRGVQADEVENVIFPYPI